MRRRPGFTLIEVITAITLTAVVSTIAAVAVASARDAGATIARHRTTLDAESRWRAMVSDMLRHAPAADRVNEPLFTIAPGGNPASLAFLSQGVVQPFGTGRIWRITVEATETGLSLDATALGRGPAMAPLHALLPHLRGLDVAVLERAADAGQWRPDWPVTRSRPAVVRLTFTGADGSAVTPLVVGLAAPATGIAAGAP